MDCSPCRAAVDSGARLELQNASQFCVWKAEPGTLKPERTEDQPKLASYGELKGTH